MRFIIKMAFAAGALQLVFGQARADLLELPQSVMFFGGAMVDENMLDAADVFGADFENNVLVGLGYQVLPYRFGQFDFGLEAGFAGRFGRNASSELWGGVVARYDGVALGPVRVSPSFTFGLSHVTNTQRGRERDNEQERDGNARTLFYLGPELSFSSKSLPNTEVFWRVHHRSGAWGTLGDMRGGANANVIGVRYKF